MIRYRYVMMLGSLLCVSCNMKTLPKTAHEKSNSLDYVVNERLSLKDYSNVQGYFPSGGLISTAELAFQIAEPVFINLYGRDIIEAEKPFSINIENDIWMIEGTLKENIDGGVAYMEIDKNNGAILKVIHTK